MARSHFCVEVGIEDEASSAGADSQPLAWISASSWPAPQPA